MSQGKENHAIQKENQKDNIESMDLSINSYSVQSNDTTQQTEISQLPLNQRSNVTYIDNCKIKSSNIIFCSEYSQDVLNHWLETEAMSSYIIPTSLMEHTPLPAATFKKMRVTLFDWLISIQIYLKMSNDALHLCMSIVDRFTCKEGNLIGRENYQLVALSSVSLACKYEDVNIPSTALLCGLSDNAYTVYELCKMEKLIYLSLNYCIGNPQPNCFLRFFSIFFDRNSSEHNLAKYFVELSLIFPCLAHIKPSLRAMSCLSLANELITCNLEMQNAFQNLPTICENELIECIQILKRVIKEVIQSKTEYSVCKKFKDKKYRSVSELRCLHML